MLQRLSERIASHTYSADGVQRVVHYLWCPGCDDVHAIDVQGPSPWTWDGNVDDPTYSPSLLVSKRRPAAPTGGWVDTASCHSFIVAGQWQFLGDSAHTLAGQTVPMVAYPEEYL